MFYLGAIAWLVVCYCLYCPLFFKCFYWYLGQSLKDQNSQKSLQKHPYSPEDLSFKRQFQVSPHPQPIKDRPGARPHGQDKTGSNTFWKGFSSDCSQGTGPPLRLLVFAPGDIRPATDGGRSGSAVGRQVPPALSESCDRSAGRAELCQ